MEYMLEFVKNYWLLMLFTVLAIILVRLVKKNWNRVRYNLMLLDYSIPLIGRTARYVRRGYEPKRSAPFQNWFPAETATCRDFKNYSHAEYSNPDLFQNCELYLQKVGENHRRETPIWVWLVMIVLLFIEAYGFSYIISLLGFSVASASQLPILAVSIAILFSVALLYFTHAMGSELYSIFLFRQTRFTFMHTETKGRNFAKTTNLVNNLNSNQNVDDQENISIQRLNRFPAERVRKPTNSVVSIVLIALIAAASIYIRFEYFTSEQFRTFQDLRSQCIVQHEGAGNMSKEEVNGICDAQYREMKEQFNADSNGALATFIVMAVIFVAIQGVAIGVGYRFGFYGSQSKRAWQLTHRFNGFSEYKNHVRQKIENIERDAQTKLSKVQAKLVNKIVHEAIKPDDVQIARNNHDRSFANYIKKSDETEDQENTLRIEYQQKQKKTKQTKSGI